MSSHCHGGLTHESLESSQYLLVLGVSKLGHVLPMECVFVVWVPAKMPEIRGSLGSGPERLF